MIESIAAKNVNANGQLEVFDFPHNDIRSNEFKVGKKKIEKSYLTVIFNHSENLKSILALARFYLVISSGKLSKNICETISHESNPSFEEKISSDNILVSIVFYNASYDYLKSLVRMIFSSKQEIVQDYPKDKVEVEIQNSGIEKKEWQIALSNLINTDKTSNKYKDWFKNNKIMTASFKQKCKSLKKMNEILRKKYKANQLKHSAVPNFLLSGFKFTQNIKEYIPLDNFYDQLQDGVQSIWGIPADSLNIDDAQNFLIDYNIKTVNLCNDLLKSIRMM